MFLNINLINWNFIKKVLQSLWNHFPYTCWPLPFIKKTTWMLKFLFCVQISITKWIFCWLNYNGKTFYCNHFKADVWWKFDKFMLLTFRFIKFGWKSCKILTTSEWIYWQVAHLSHTGYKIHSLQSCINVSKHMEKGKKWQKFISWNIYDSQKSWSHSTSTAALSWLAWSHSS